MNIKENGQLVSVEIDDDVAEIIEANNIFFSANGTRRLQNGSFLHFKKNTELEPFCAFYSGNLLCNIGTMSYLAHVPNPGYTQLRVGRFSSLGPNLCIPMPRHPVEALSTSVFTYNRSHKIVWAALADGGDPNDLDFASPSLVSAPQKGEVVIGNDVWIGANVSIMPGTIIGDGSVIATGAVITKNIPAYEIWGGNPARLIKKRFADDTVAVLKALKWWRFHPRDLAKFKMQTPEAFINDFLPAHGALEPYTPEKINLWNQINDFQAAQQSAPSSAPDAHLECE